MAEKTNGSDSAGASETASEVTFHYIKSPQYRTLHADGVLGAPTPRGNRLFFTIFSERGAIPQETTYTLLESNERGERKLGKEIMARRVVRPGIVRELEVGVVMDRAGARELHAWLERQLKIEKPDTPKGKGE